MSDAWPSLPPDHVIQPAEPRAGSSAAYRIVSRNTLTGLIGVAAHSMSAKEAIKRIADLRKGWPVDAFFIELEQIEPEPEQAETDALPVEPEPAPLPPQKPRPAPPVTPKVSQPGLF